MLPSLRKDFGTDGEFLDHLNSTAILRRMWQSALLLSLRNDYETYQVHSSQYSDLLAFFLSIPLSAAEAFPPAARTKSHQGKDSCIAGISLPQGSENFWHCSWQTSSEVKKVLPTWVRVERFWQRADFPRAVDDSLHDDGAHTEALVTCATT